MLQKLKGKVIGLFVAAALTTDSSQAIAQQQFFHHDIPPYFRISFHKKHFSFFIFFCKKNLARMLNISHKIFVFL